MRRAKTVCVECMALCLILSIVPAAADSLSDWYSSGDSHEYAAIRGEIERIYRETVDSGVPGEILTQRIREGAAKHVDPEVFLAAFRKDCERFSLLASLYRDLPGGDGAANPPQAEFVARCAVILRSGVSLGVVSSILSERDGIGVSRKIGALLAVAAVHTRFPLDDGEEVTLVRALCRSRESEGIFSRLSSLFVRGRSGSLGIAEITEIVAMGLESGGSFFRVEDEMNRRLR
jgi:hypothetical protein